MTEAEHRIIVTTGPGARSGLQKISVAIEGVAPMGRARHYIYPRRADTRIAELQQEYPGAPVIHRTR